MSAAKVLLKPFGDPNTMAVFTVMYMLTLSLQCEARWIDEMDYLSKY